MEKVNRIFRTYVISRDMKPFKTLKQIQILEHPKDKRSIEDIAKCMYKIPCHEYDGVYIGETGRSLCKRLEERKHTETVSRKVHTRTDRKASLTEVNKSAIMDHVDKDSHVINRTGAKSVQNFIEIGSL